MPYTVQLGGCGDPGQYIHWTPNYVNTFDYDTTKLQFGPAGRLFYFIHVFETTFSYTFKTQVNFSWGNGPDCATVFLKSTATPVLTLLSRPSIGQELPSSQLIWCPMFAHTNQLTSWLTTVAVLTGKRAFTIRIARTVLQIHLSQRHPSCPTTECSPRYL